MADRFDPYLKWLAIPPDEQPPNHYRLLALPLFIDDPDVIENAADQRMGHIRKFQSGPHRDASQQILNEIAAAKVCLLNAARKAAYDRQLKSEQEVAEPAPAPTAEPAPPQAAAPPVATPAPPRMTAPPVSEAAPYTEQPPSFLPVSTASTSMRRSHSSSVWIIAAAGGVALAVGLIVLMAILGGDQRPETAGDGASSDPAAADATADGSSAPPPPPPVGPAPPEPRGAEPRPPVPTELPGGRDLLPLSDLSRRVVAGRWHGNGEELTVEPGSLARVTLPYAPRFNYEVLVHFTRTEGDDAVALLLPLGDRYAMLQLSSAGGSVSGLSLLEGRRPTDADNPTRRDGALENGRRYALQVTVTGGTDRITVDAKLNGQPYIRWQGRASALSEDPFWKVRNRMLALGAHNARVVFHRVQVRDLKARPTLTLQRGATLEGHEGAIWSIAFAPTGHTLASASGDHTVRLWDTAAAELRQTLEGHDDQLRSVAFGPRGRHLASAGLDGVVRLWNLDDGSVVKLEGHAGAVNSVAISPEGKRVASAGVNGELVLWDVAPPYDGTAVEAHEQPITCVAFAPKGSVLATGGGDNVVRLWLADTGDGVRTLTGHERGIYTLAFSPDGTTLATAGFDADIRLWYVGTGRERGALSGHENLVRCVAFSPDGAHLASAGRDNTVRIWDPASGAELAIINDAADVRCVAFSPDGKTLASAGDDQKIKLWDIRRAQR